MESKFADYKAVLRIAVFLTAAAAMFPFDLHAQTTHSLAVGGAGDEPCSAWTSAREGTSEDAKLDSQKRVEWVTGFFTAVNFLTQPSGNLHGGIDDREGMLSWIDTHCRANPKDPLFVAAIDLFFDLRNHPRK